MARVLSDDVDGWAEKQPDAAAIIWADESGDLSSLSYRALSERSNRIARFLIDRGVERGDRVAICIPKGPHAIAAMLGAAKAGAPYVPLDPESPTARIALILTAAQPRVLIGSSDAVAAVQAAVQAAEAEPGSPGPLVIGTLDEAAPAWPISPAFTRADVDQHATTSPDVGVDDDDLAHILFTSGSTGVPKGVMITHRNVMSFVDWVTGHFGYTSDDQISGHSPLHFDLSTMDIYGTFAAGATLHPVPPKANVNPADLAAFIRERKLTQWFSVPSALNHLVRFDVLEPGDFPHLERLVWCGEVLPTPTLISLMSKIPHAEFTNLYGPTEATIASSWFQVADRPADPTAEIPIGRACAGEELHVLTPTGSPAATDEIGELYIEGVGLSPGYWRDVEKTTSTFRTDLIAGRRLYNTGDLARRRADGELIFVGRSDTQVKSRGYRIELGEIEAALRVVDGVVDSAVVAIDAGGFDGVTICGAYVASETVKPGRIRNGLGATIPRYMVPQRWLRFDELPKNVNGKVDRPALRAAFEEDRRP